MYEAQSHEWPYRDQPDDVRTSAGATSQRDQRLSLLSHFGLAGTLGGALAPWERRLDCEQGHDWNQGPAASAHLRRAPLEELSAEDLDTLYWWVAEGPSLFFDAKGLADLDREFGPGAASAFKEKYAAFGLPLDGRHDEARAVAIGRFIGDRLRSIIVSLDPPDLRLDFDSSPLLASYVGLLLSGLARVHVPTLLTLTRRLGLAPRRNPRGLVQWCAPTGAAARDRAARFQELLDRGLKGDPKACTPPPPGTKYRPLYEWLDGMTHLGIQALTAAWWGNAGPQPDSSHIMRLDLVRGADGAALGKFGVARMLSESPGRLPEYWDKRILLECSPNVLPPSALSPSWWSNGKAQTKTWRRAWQAAGFTAHPVVVDGVVEAVDFREMSEERTAWRLRRDFEHQPPWDSSFAPVPNPSAAASDAGPAGGDDNRYTDALMTSVFTRVTRDHFAAYTLNRTRIVADLSALYERREERTNRHQRRAELRAEALEELSRDPRRGSTSRVATEFGVSRRTVERWRRGASGQSAEPST